MIPKADVREMTFNDYLVVIDKRKWIIVTFFIILVSSVAFFSFWAQPIYRATTVILIEREQQKVISVEEVYGMGIADRDYYETQYKILRSRTLIKRLFDEINLYLDPEFAQSQDPILEFTSRLIVEPVRNSRLVNLSFDGPDPKKTATIVNTLAELYIKQDIETRTKASRDAVLWLMDQIASAKKKLEESETTLVKFMEAEKITEAPAMEKKDKEPDLIESLKKEQVRLEVEMSEVSKRYGPKHPNMVKLLSELESIKSKIAIETQNAIELNRKSTQYTILKREVDSTRDIYDALLKRAKEAGISEQLELSNIRIVDPAEIPEVPIRPKKANNIALACLIGIMMGLGIAFFVEYLDNTIKDPDDVTAYMALPFLGYVPSARKEVKSPEEIDLIVYQKPRSVISEAYRSIRTSILFAFADKPGKTILLTSTNPQEGKTSAAINLGITMANTGEKVLLVDGDLRCSRLHKSFGLAKETGLSDYLIGKVDLDKVLKPTTIENLYLLSAGSTPPNPAELLSSARMKTFLEETKRRFDRIIIDGTPILTFTDAAIVANMVDGVIMLVRCGKVPIEIVVRAKQKLLDSKANILGVLLNNVDYGKESYYYYYYYSDEDRRKA
jgi:capsular exopolysaccharide synthesis family protein